MPNHKTPALEESRKEFRKLKDKLRPRYSDYVLDHFPTIDLPKLYQAKAGRVLYPEGLAALQLIARLYPRRTPGAHQPA